MRTGGPREGRRPRRRRIRRAPCPSLHAAQAPVRLRARAPPLPHRCAARARPGTKNARARQAAMGGNRPSRERGSPPARTREPGRKAGSRARRPAQPGREGASPPMPARTSAGSWTQAPPALRLPSRETPGTGARPQAAPVPGGRRAYGVRQNGPALRTTPNAAGCRKAAAAAAVPGGQAPAQGGGPPLSDLRGPAGRSLPTRTAYGPRTSAPPRRRARTRSACARSWPRCADAPPAGAAPSRSASRPWHSLPRRRPRRRGRSRSRRWTRDPPRACAPEPGAAAPCRYRSAQATRGPRRAAPPPSRPAHLRQARPPPGNGPSHRRERRPAGRCSPVRARARARPRSAPSAPDRVSGQPQAAPPRARPTRPTGCSAAAARRRASGPPRRSRNTRQARPGTRSSPARAGPPRTESAMHGRAACRKQGPDAGKPATTSSWGAGTVVCQNIQSQSTSRRGRSGKRADQAALRAATPPAMRASIVAYSSTATLLGSSTGA